MKTKRAIKLFPALAVGLFLAFGSLQANAQTKQEVVLWESIKDSNRVGDYLAYLDTYPQGTFVPLAKGHLQDLTPFTVVEYSLYNSDISKNFAKCDQALPASQTEFRPSHLPDRFLFALKARDAHLGDEFRVIFQKPDGSLVYTPTRYRILKVSFDDQNIFCVSEVLGSIDAHVPGTWKVTVSVNRIDKLVTGIDLLPR